MKKILVYGSVNIDSTFIVNHIVNEGETLSSTNHFVGAGGKGANQAVAIAKALHKENIKVYFGGKVGNDGEWILSKLNGYGVNTSFVSNSPNGTGQAIIQLDKDGKNSIILFGGGNQEITKEEIIKVFEFFSAGDILVINGEVNNLSLMFEMALSKSMDVVVNPSPVSESVLSLPLEKAKILIVNEIEGAMLCNSFDSSLEELLNLLMKKYPNTEIVLTAGSRGSYFGYKKEVYYQDIVKVQVVDTVGAGDTFLGYFVGSRILGLSAVEAMKKASKASSITVTQKGAMDAIPII
ncbi:MAG: ribokinase [Sphaerochaetaceae bacterium]|nr:ribokinase [Sphaerochaetaceae bacterium]